MALTFRKVSTRAVFFVTCLTLTLLRSLPLWAEGPTPSSDFRKDLKILQAFKGPHGEFIVRFEDNPADFPAENSVFWGTGNTLHQLELSWNEQEAMLFYDPRFKSESAELTVKDTQATVQCGKKKAIYTALSASELKKLESSMHSGNILLSALPRVLDPLYLFRIKNAQPPEYVFILSPRFDFHREYDVRIGRPGDWKPIETVVRAREPGSLEADPIHFRSGGGIHVPASLGIFSASSSDSHADRGSPTLIRANGAAMEALVRPDLSQTELKNLGFFDADAKPAVPVNTPCDSLVP